MSNKYISVCEYDYLFRGSHEDAHEAIGIPEKDWDWLILNEAKLGSKSKSLVRVSIKNQKQVLQVLNYVGVIALPSGIVIEILPKNVQSDSIETSRIWLLKMITKTHDLPSASMGDTALQTINTPLLEVLIGRFLASVQHLISKGLRSQYVNIDQEAFYLRGKLRLSDHLKMLPGHQHIFPIQHDEYILNRPENRLLHWSVNQVYIWSKDSNHRSQARKFLTLFSSIPMSQSPQTDLCEWRNDRLMQHYNPIRPWIELILKGVSPWTQRGAVEGISMLFPMEKLFEQYVFHTLKKAALPDCKLVAQSRVGWLAQHMGQGVFGLKPDILLKRNSTNVAIIDTKWKIIRENKLSDEYGIYGISQSDMYQLFAYGQRCLGGKGDLFLIYPKSKIFSKPLPVFSYGDQNLWIVPFDLEKDKIVEDETSDYSHYSQYFK